MTLKSGPRHVPVERVPETVMTLKSGPRHVPVERAPGPVMSPSGIGIFKELHNWRGYAHASRDQRGAMEPSCDQDCIVDAAS